MVKISSSDNFSTASTSTASSSNWHNPTPLGAYPQAKKRSGGCVLSSLTAQKYLGWALLLFNGLYMAGLCLFSDEFAKLFLLLLAPFSIAYAVSLCFAFFSLLFHKPWLLYPLLITTIPLALIPLLISALYLSHHICLLLPQMLLHPMNSSEPSNVSVFGQTCPPDVLFPLGMQPLRIAPRSLVAIIVLLLIFLEKTAELFFFWHLKRKIQKGKKREEEEGRGSGKSSDRSEAAGPKRKRAKRMSVVRQQSVVEESPEDELPAGAEEDTVYDNGMHRPKKNQGRAQNQPANPNNSPVPIAHRSKRVIV